MEVKKKPVLKVFVTCVLIVKLASNQAPKFLIFSWAYLWSPTPVHLVYKPPLQQQPNIEWHDPPVEKPDTASCRRRSNALWVSVEWQCRTIDPRRWKTMIDRCRNPAVNQSRCRTCQKLHRLLQPVGICPTGTNSNAVLQNTNLSSRRRSNTVWSIISNAEPKSRKTNNDTCCLFILSKMSFWTRSDAVSVLPISRL